MRLWPDSLFGRLIAAIGAVMIAIAAVIVLLIVREHNEFELRGSGVDAVAAQIVAVATELAAVAGAERDARLATQVTQPLLPASTRQERAYPGAGREQRPRRRALENRLADRVRKALGADFTVTVQRARRPTRPFVAVGELGKLLAGDRASVSARRALGEAVAASGGENRLPRLRMLEVDVRLPDGMPVTFRTLEPEPGPELPRRIFRDLLLLFLLVAIVLFWTTRSITRPLRELEAAADALGRGRRSVVLRESGARELRNATRAFNAMQERLNRYLDGRTRVLAAMSHDLRTPLTRLRLRAETLSDPTQRERVIADLEEMTTMVNQALQVFRGQEANESPERVDLRALLDDLAAAAAEAGEHIDVVGSASAMVNAQPQALRRCLGNVLDNARRYAGGARVELETRTDSAVVRIVDRGPGIAETELAQVFEPFYRGENSRNSDTGGTGLGLGIARDLAQAQGGTLTLRNAPGGGLIAELMLPRATS